MVETFTRDPISERSGDRNEAFLRKAKLGVINPEKLQFFNEKEKRLLEGVDTAKLKEKAERNFDPQKAAESDNPFSTPGRTVDGSGSFSGSGGGGGGFGAGGGGGGGEGQVGANVQGIADMINKAADRSIARISQGVERSQQQVQQGFTGRGLRRSGLAAGAVEEVQDQAMRQQEGIDTERIRQLSELGRQAVQNRADRRLQRMQIEGQQETARLSARLNASARSTRGDTHDHEQTQLFGAAMKPGQSFGDPFPGDSQGGGGLDLSERDLFSI